MKKHLISFLVILLPALFSFAQTHPFFNNPILSGFHPDPSITRVGDTYYLVNSSFEWYPGLPIHKSKDLVNWELIGYAVSNPDYVTFKEGLNDNGGMFAPTIRYHDGLFYVICTSVGAGGNFFVTAKSPEGPWSKPTWIKALGIDPSLYWENNKCYYTGAGNITPQSEKDWKGKNGIWMQELDTKKGELIGERIQLTHGQATNARYTEGPHLYKIDNKYLLLAAEGGTSEFHAITAFLSDNVTGPYTPIQCNPIITHRNLGYTYPIIQTGHGDLVQTQNGEWWIVLLGKRPIKGYSMLARETFLAKVEMTIQDGELTPMVNPGKGLVQLKQLRPNLPWTPVKPQPNVDNFNNASLSLYWNFLRTPTSKWYNIDKGELNIKLRPKVISKLENPSFIAQRVRSLYFSASTKVNFSAKGENEFAGLVYYRNSKSHYQLLKGKEYITLVKSYILEHDKHKIANNSLNTEIIAKVPYKNDNVVLKLIANGIDGQFYYGPSKDKMIKIGNKQDLSILADEKAMKFNGCFIGMYSTSNNIESNNIAKFDWFEQMPLNKVQ